MYIVDNNKTFNIFKTNWNTCIVNSIPKVRTLNKQWKDTIMDNPAYIQPPTTLWQLSVCSNPKLSPNKLTHTLSFS